MRESRKYNPVRPTKKNGDSDEGKLENGWDAALTQFRAKLHDIVRSGQPSGGLSPEMALAAKIAHTVKEDLKRSVSRIFYCVLVHHFTDFAISATAAPGHQSWRGKAPPECGGLLCRPPEGDPPGKADPHSGSTRIERGQYEGGHLRKT